MKDMQKQELVFISDSRELTAEGTCCFLHGWLVTGKDRILVLPLSVPREGPLSSD